ncbi:hemerythrin family protein [Geotalea daltonii FRC-32]|uniref:Hemerythrin family protein n=1 Tax=Geotalea daltonii (strain DSM 22248 / JCM 15807 / FRC-32) TaxID=316067 RepID=B9LZP1_GEODF|nr:bacteriohemerythrin [Geotalea daltonii]ACM18855.1 hemerythrin family protein [Geotalea daltonii FRC-32]
MSLITWNQSLSVNVKQFDEQHKKLIDLINKLHDAMKAGKGKDVLGEILQSLVDYTKQHFAAEEALLQKHGYGDYEKHKKEHNLLVMQVADIQKKLKEGSPVLTQTVMTFLKDWLSNHIQREDQKYGPFLNDKGLS